MAPRTPASSPQTAYNSLSGAALIFTSCAPVRPTFNVEFHYLQSAILLQTSDHRHPIATPAQLLLAEFLARV